MAEIIVSVSLKDDDFNEQTFEGRATISADWMKDFTKAREISDAVAKAFLDTTAGHERQAFKEYDPTFQCGICGAGPTVNVRKHYHVCERCNHGIELHGLEEWLAVIDRDRG